MKYARRPLVSPRPVNKCGMSGRPRRRQDRVCRSETRGDEGRLRGRSDGDDDEEEEREEMEAVWVG